MSVGYEKIIKYIDERLKQGLTLEEIARFAGYSTWHMYKIFKVYTAVPIMEYVRKKKLYAAASELYTGRKIYDIALDYGYETPSGFYKAFYSIFGCSPSEYKNNNHNELKELNGGFMNIEIKTVKSIEEVDECWEFLQQVYSHLPWMKEEQHRNGFYQSLIERLENIPELLLYARDDDKICGTLFGGFPNPENGYMVLDEGIIEEYKNTGIYEALFVEMEKRAKKIGCLGIAVAIGESEEEFYASLGYTGRMLVQSDKHTIDDLKDYLASLNNPNYTISTTRVHDGYINQLWLNIPIMDKDLKKKFEQELGNCWTQMVVNKEI